MHIKVIFKNYGKGKCRVILIDKQNNMAFACFGEKTEQYKYLKQKTNGQN